MSAKRASPSWLAELRALDAPARVRATWGFVVVIAYLSAWLADPIFTRGGGTHVLFGGFFGNVRWLLGLAVVIVVASLATTWLARQRRWARRILRIGVVGSVGLVMLAALGPAAPDVRDWAARLHESQPVPLAPGELARILQPEGALRAYAWNVPTPDEWGGPAEEETLTATVDDVVLHAVAWGPRSVRLWRGDCEGYGCGADVLGADDELGGTRVVVVELPNHRWLALTSLAGARWDLDGPRTDVGTHSLDLLPRPLAAPDWVRWALLAAPLAGLALALAAHRSRGRAARVFRAVEARPASDENGLVREVILSGGERLSLPTPLPAAAGTPFVLVTRDETRAGYRDEARDAAIGVVRSREDRGTTLAAAHRRTETLEALAVWVVLALTAPAVAAWGSGLALTLWGP